MRIRRNLFQNLLLRLMPLALAFFAGVRANARQGREDEIVANISAGRIILQVAGDGIIFAALEQSAEPDSVPPRVVALDSGHVGILLGATDWQIPAGSLPIRIESRLPRPGTGGATPTDPNAARQRLQDENSDLELIGVAWLEALRSLAGQLHHKIALGPDEPLLQIVVIGYAPGSYGPEIWLYEFRITQEAFRGNYYQTKVLRPRTTQLYPPEKHEPRTIVEVRSSPALAGPSLREKIQQNDELILRLTRSEPKFARVVEKIQAGKANAANFVDAADFIRAAAVPLAGKGRFTVGTFRQDRGLNWLVAPEEPATATGAKDQKDQKDRPADAPTLRKKPKPGGS